MRDPPPAAGDALGPHLKQSGQLFFERLPGFARRGYEKSARVHRMRAAYSEPSYPMPLVGFRYDVLRYELAEIGLGNPLLQVSPFLIAQDVYAGAARLDLARIFGKLVLILLGPRGDLLE